MPKVKVLLVEDHIVVRQGIKALLSDEPDIEIVGEAGNGREALPLVAGLQPDVVLMDISMPGLNGIEATWQIRQRYPEVKVVILSMHANEEYVFRVLPCGKRDTCWHQGWFFQWPFIHSEEIDCNCMVLFIL